MWGCTPEKSDCTPARLVSIAVTSASRPEMSDCRLEMQENTAVMSESMLDSTSHHHFRNFRLQIPGHSYH